MALQIKESDQSFSTWVNQPNISPVVRGSLQGVDILFIPEKGYAGREDLLFFPEGTEELVQFIGQHKPSGLSVGVCIEEEDYKELARYADILIIAGAVATSLVAPVLVNLISDYIGRRLGTKKDDAVVKWSLTIEDKRSERFLKCSYDGPAETFKETMSDALEKIQSGDVPMPVEEPKQLGDTAKRLPRRKRK
jgi:hypothetical protein